MRLASRSHRRGETQRTVDPVGTPTCPTPVSRRHPLTIRVGHHNFPLARVMTKTRRVSPVGPNLPDDQRNGGIHHGLASGTQLPHWPRDKRDPHSLRQWGPNFPGHISRDTHVHTARDPSNKEVTMNDQTGLLFDPLLKVLASQVDDLETLRIANSNRFGMLTRTAVDDDGIRRGLGLPEDHRDVKRMALTLESLAAVEKQAISQLQSHMRRSVWGPWIKGATGVGEKQLARLLGEIGDPYWNTLHERPRTVSELWAYCGFHTLAVSQTPVDAQPACAGGTQLSTGQPSCDTQPEPASGTRLPVGQVHGETHLPSTGGNPRTAPKRQRGQKANWSEEARKRAWLIATSCVKAPAGSKYRTVYDETRAKYAEAVHNTPCVRCGPKGKPAEVGSLLPPAHQHARALRAIAKKVLKDLWIEASRLHGELGSQGDAHPAVAS